MSEIETIEELEAIYGQPGETSTVKVADRITTSYARYVEASPFAVLATSGPEGLDCSPRGDKPGFVRIANDRTLLLPDRRGNNRVDSLRNIVRDPRAALLFLIPGSGNTLRVNCRAKLSVEADLLATFVVEDKTPQSVIVLGVQEVYFQCARAIMRANLWDAAGDRSKVDVLPTPGQILAEMSDDRVGGKTYDQDWPERARRTMW